MDGPRQPDLDQLARVVRELTDRVDRLERRLGLEGAPGPPVTAKPPENKVISIARRPKGSLESQIGTQWLNRIGIIAVLFGVAFFLKYAFENRWIGPAGRVSFGVLAGIGLMMWSERFRARGYRVFSFSLKAVSIGVLYLSFWAAFQLYKLVPLGVAFLAMVVVTATTAILSWFENAEMLALFALIGGFATPPLLYTGQNSETELFVYVLLLNFAIVLLAVVRPWRRLLLAGWAGTVVLYFAWYLEFYEPGELAATVAFATLFFLVFAIAPLVDSAPPADRHSRAVFAVALLNALVYMLQMYLVFERLDRNAAALSALGLSVLYAVLGWQFRSYSTLDRLHSSLAIAFLTLAIALRFDSQWITILWFFEAAALMTIGFWRHSPAVRWQALAVLALTVVKVFAYDVWQLERGYRIVSFIALGILLLVISFVYQKNWLPIHSANISVDKKMGARRSAEP